METPEQTPAPFDSLAFIMAFEQDHMELPELVQGFSELIRSGMAWTLQGTYGRTAMSLIEQGFISRDGTIHWDAVTAAEDSL